MKLATIYAYELRRALRGAAFYIYYAILAAMGLLFVAIASGAFKNAAVDFGSGAKVMINAPYSLATIVDVVTLFGVVIVAAIAGQATYQDEQHESTSFFYTSPISKLDYLGGRYLAALTQLFLIFSAVAAGAFIGTLLPWPDRSHIGPNHLAAYLQPYAVVVLPILVLFTSIFFALTLWTRRMLPSYVAAVLGIVGYQVAQNATNNISTNRMLALFDPFGLNAANIVTQYWTPFERNTQLLPLTDVLLWNRLIWLGAGIAIAAVAYWRFSPSVAARRARRAAPAEGVADAAVVPVERPAARLDYSFGATLTRLMSGVRLQFRDTVRSIFFVVVVLAGFSMTLTLLLSSPSDMPIHPVTYMMLEWGRGAFGIFALAILTFYAGELVWRDREAKIDQLIDSQPVSTWVLYGSKLGALLLVAIVLVVVVFAAGIVAQVSQGYFRFELGEYFHDLVAHRLVAYWILCAIAVLVQVLVNQRYLGYFAIVAYFVASLALPSAGFNDYLYRVGQVPKYVYSDLNGYGVYAAAVAWFQAYWGVAAAGMVLIAGLFWVRGTDGGWRTRLRIAAARLTPAPRAALLSCTIVFVALGGFIYYNTHVLNVFRTPYAQAELQAQYETLYRARYQSMPEPRLTDVDERVDIVPEQRAATIAGSMRLRNETRRALREVAVTLPQTPPAPGQPYGLQRLSFDGGDRMIVGDPGHGFWVYELARPLAPGASVTMHFVAAYTHRGFPNDDPDTAFSDNGTFLTDAFAPEIGYRADLEIQDDATRHRHGLQGVYRMAPPWDAAARRDNTIGPNADFVNFHVTIGTAPDQVAIFPGALRRTWTANGRRYFEYATEAPMLAIYSIVSGRYAVRHDRWHDVALSIYYHPGHEYDLDSMMNGMKRALDFASSEYDPYQFKELRIVEFPRYQNFAESLPATIPYTESWFINKYDRKDPAAIDYDFYVTAHEVGHQWWAHQVVTANTQGAGILETLAQYTALRVMRRAFGPESMKNYLRHELNTYFQRRAIEANEEQPLYRVEHQGYIYYSKGGQVMYTLAEYAGERRIDGALSAFVRHYRFKGAPYPTTLQLMQYLERATPAQYAYLYDDLFRHITVFDNRALSATYTTLPGGKYAVTLTVLAKKYRADGKGEERPVPVNDYMEIGVQDASGKYLYLQNRKIVSEKATLRLIVAGKPDKAGVDPIDLLLDRNPDGDVIPVSKA